MLTFAEQQSVDIETLEAVVPFPFTVGIEGSVIRVTAKAVDRVEAKNKIESNLKSNNISFKDGVKASSSIEGFKTIDATFNDGKVYRIFVKPNKQSGAGAETTALGECFQAYASSARQIKGGDLVSPDEVFELDSKRNADADRPLKKTQSLPANWQYSGFTIANQLNSFLGSGTYTFHRGSSLVDRLESEFQYHKKKQKINIRDINKWSPADIWAAKKNFKMPSGHFSSLADYNQFLLEKFRTRDLVGVSLKVLGIGKTAKLEVFNDQDTAAAGVSLIGFTTTLTSKDVYVHFKKNGKNGSMQLRTFSSGKSGWQGEIKGAAAAGGKIGGGVLEAFYKDVDNRTRFIDQGKAKRHVDRVTPEFIAQMHAMYNAVAPSMISLEDMEKFLRTKSVGDRYSKFLALQYANLLAGLSVKKQQQVLSDVVGYASSSTSFSAVFIKYS